MFGKTLTTLITVIAGIGAALLRLLDPQQARRAAARAGGRTGSSRYLYILPAFAAITLYLIYPAILTFINSFKDNLSRQWVGIENYTDAASTDQASRQTLFNTLLWIIIVPAVDGRARPGGGGPRPTG